MTKQMLSIGSRMKQYYEDAYKIVLPMRMPVIVRTDGRAFHRLTHKLQKPHDERFLGAMWQTAYCLCQEVEGTVFAFVQSDEISLLLHNYRQLCSQAWFGNELQKIVSSVSALASVTFTGFMGLTGTFDARAFVLPEAEVANYFIWRQQDAVRNSVQGYARTIFSHRELHKKNQSTMLSMMYARGFDWDGLPPYLQRGVAMYYIDDWFPDLAPPHFTTDRNYIERWLVTQDG